MTDAAARKRTKLTWSGDRLGLARRQRHLEDVERHRHQHVVAAHAHQIDYARLAERIDRALVVDRRDTVGREVFGDEVVDDALDLAREGRRLAGTDRFHEFSRQAGLAGEAGMSIELVLRLEVP